MRPDEDIATTGAAISNVRKERHAHWKGENTAALIAAGLPFRASNNGECLMLREPGKPAVDFYPSSGRWRLPHSNVTMGGHADRFIAFYSRARA